MPDVAGPYVVQLVVNDGIADSDPVTVQVQAVTRMTAAVQSAQTLQSEVASLPPVTVKNESMTNALSNKINAVIANIEAGNYAVALGQLQNDILKKTDGVATIGRPDNNDWITDVETQLVVYPYVKSLIARVKALMG